MLDIKATDKGLLIPRVALTGINDVTTIPDPATGLMVFNTNEVNDMTRSFYFWNGFFWDHVEGPNQWVSNIYGIYNLSDYIGIGTSNPLHRLHVNGNTYISGYLGVGESNPQYRLHTTVGYFTYRIGVATIPDATYSIDVAGPVRIQDDIRVNGILNPNNPLTIGNNLTVEGTVVVNTNKGIVRSNSSTQQKIVRTSVNLVATSLGVGSYVDSGNFYFEAFGGVPSVMVGQIVDGSSTGEWYKIQLIPFDVTANSCKFRLFNTASDAVTMTGSWSIIVIGPQ